MSFISYAQNMEDVMLWRALKNINEGFYIDVGANDPVQDSVTKAFYDNGWSGINIEPLPQYIERLKSDRPRDINLQLAAGYKSRERVLYEFSDTGLSTLNKGIAEQHETNHGYKKRELKITEHSLTEICLKYNISTVHFLKIDVEGTEQQVIEGLNLHAIRPWIIVVESLLPTTQIETYDSWESLLLKAQYEFVFFDGLNRYYTAKEHHELTNSFVSPPNIFDNFIFSGTGNSAAHRQQYSALKTITRQKQNAHHLKEQFELTLKKYLADMEKTKSALDKNRTIILQLYSSRSWQITSPLRWCSYQAQLLQRDGTYTRFKSFLKRLLKILLFAVDKYSRSAPKYRYFLVYLADKLGIYSRLKSLIRINDFTNRVDDITLHSENLSVEAQLIYSQLKDLS